jgi:hypothetical protein
LLSKLRKKVLHIQKVISVVLLMVFAIALTPFSVLHHHDEAPDCLEGTALSHVKTCGHKFHIGTHEDHCLVCEAHFEKNYTTTTTHYQVYLEYKLVSKYYRTTAAAYTQLIGTALRGPPTA